MAEKEVDLAALDALFQAATPGEWALKTWAGVVEWVGPDGGEHRFAECYDSNPYDGDAEAKAKWIAALHNAWPAIRRDLARLEIGDAAVAVIDAESEAGHWLAGVRMSKCPTQKGGLNRKRVAAVERGKAARARLRALREESDARS